ncbi:MAG: ABC transporter permease [Gemmatimonadetes bacterium]|nr:ABC transporter permease [Gemmatimonadota bacterium]
MLKNYIAVLIRYMLKNKQYVVLNIAGLAIGMTTVMLIALFVQHEFSYDRSHKDSHLLYRVLRETRSEQGQSTYSERLSGALGLVIREEMPEVNQVVRLHRRDAWIKYQDRVFEQILCLADEGLLETFHFPIHTGGPAQRVLREPGSILVTQSAAQRFFGSENPIGQVLSVENYLFGGEYCVAGVLKDIPNTSTIFFDFLVSPESLRNEFRYWDTWLPRGAARVEIYLRLSETASLKSLEAKLNDAMLRHMGEEIARTNAYHLQRVTDIYLLSGDRFGILKQTFSYIIKRPYGSLGTVEQASLIGVLILVIAAMNFVNLSTALSISRNREVALRKVVGATRGQLIRQFLGESLLLSLLALLVAFVLTVLTLPVFRSFIDRPLFISSGDFPSIAVSSLGLALIVGLTAGLYPAIFLSGFQPASTLKGVPQLGSSKRGRLRKVLVILQFSISSILIVGTLVISSQLSFIRTQFGFNRDHIVLLPIFQVAGSVEELGPLGTQLKKRFQTIKQGFLEHPNVLKASTSRFYLQDWSAHYKFRTPEMAEFLEMRTFPVDEDFFDLYEIPFVDGKTFPREYTAIAHRERIRTGQEEYFILNEAAVKRLGLTHPVGQSFEWAGRTRGTIIGVVKNFHLRTLHEEIEPAVFTTEHWNMKILHLKIASEGVPETLEFLKETWHRFLPQRPFDYEFLDARLDFYYREEIRLGQIFGTFSLIAIFVACLGLVGLSSFMIQLRTREIGVRKVLGASVSNIVLLLFSEFSKLIVASNLIALPIAFYLLSRWLESFPYRIQLGIEPFLLSGIITIVASLTTISFHAFRAATTNPINALRTE